MKTKLKASIAFVFLCFIFLYIFSPQSNRNITVWGERVVFTDDVERAILKTRCIERMKDVDQSGPARLFGPRVPKFTRYEHSIAVYALVKRFGLSKKEQLAALLHDVSHTVFSHVADYLFTKDMQENIETAWQDKEHLNILKMFKIQDLIAKFNLTLDDLDPENPKYKALDSKLPDMCADRIQYNIHTGVIFGLITKKDARDIVNNLNYKNEKWFFTDKGIAKKFAKLSIYFTKNFWGAAWNSSMNIHFAIAIKQAMQYSKETGEISLTFNDLYTTDSLFMKKLLFIASKCQKVNLALQQCKQPVQKIHGCTYKKIHICPKFRGIDPLILQNDEFVRLSDIDAEFAKEYENVKAWCIAGYDIDVMQDT